MRTDRSMIGSILYIALGAVLLGLGIAQVVDAFWSGMGSALVAVGVIRIVHFVRFRKDETYRENQEIAKTDERIRFLRSKAWAWAGYLFVLMAAVGAIAFKLLGQDLLSIAAGGAVCLLVILYAFSYLALRKKY